MRLNDLINEFGAKLNLEIALNDGGCTLDIDGMSVTIQEIDELSTISTVAEIGEAPPQGLEKLFEAMLAANHLFAGTGGSTISFDIEKRRFYICRIDRSELMDFDAFRSMLEKFVNVLDVWRRLLADYRPEEDVDIVRSAESRMEVLAFTLEDFIRV